MHYKPRNPQTMYLTRISIHNCASVTADLPDTHRGWTPCCHSYQSCPLRSLCLHPEQARNRGTDAALRSGLLAISATMHLLFIKSHTRVHSALNPSLASAQLSHITATENRVVLKDYIPFSLAHVRGMPIYLSMAAIPRL